MPGPLWEVLSDLPRMPSTLLLHSQCVRVRVFCKEVKTEPRKSGTQSDWEGPGLAVGVVGWAVGGAE